MKRNYECLLILDQGVSGEDIEKEKNEISEIIGQDEVSFREMGLRDLSYPIAGKNRGHYLLCFFRCEPTLKETLDGKLKLKPTVMRHLVLRSAEFPPPGEGAAETTVDEDRGESAGAEAPAGPAG